MQAHDFGIFLKDLRESAGLTQSEVAASLDYTTAQFISNWERGVSKPPFDKVKKLAELYKVGSKSVFERLRDTKIQEIENEFKHLGLPRVRR